MASVLLKSAGTFVGGVLGGAAGAAAGAALGRLAGQAVDREVFGRTRRLRDVEGPRLEELAVQSSAWGEPIPLLYGTVRVAGNVIWSRPIEETVITETSSAGGKAGGGRVEQTSRTYQYTVSLAIALCEGEIDRVVRAWSDAKPLNLSQGTYRIYTGSETQLPDSYIEGFEGVGSTPAYRGLAYVVIEDFPLEDYGNRIPNFTFEVKRAVQHQELSGQSTEAMVTAITMIPGSGEFVYDTQQQTKISGVTVGSDFAQSGYQTLINVHNNEDKANALVSLDQLADDLPNVEWIGVVVNWFGTSMDAGTCTILPGVEYTTGAITEPEEWSSAGFSRTTAHPITLINGSPRYGGTPDDQSLLRYLDALIARGYKILFYPMPLMDVAGKPWRGELTGSAADVASFFTRTNGYNAFITHYANLVKDKVDGFVIGTELKGLTAVMDTTPGVFPAVNALVSLAATVKGIVGGGVKVTYAADWSEYHHEENGWYHLDPLWASPNIDMVGIDAYFPLTEDLPQEQITQQAIIDGWTSGEGYSYYWADTGRTNQQPLNEAYAWKNIEWWWKNQHTNPDASTSAWVPESKKIWFTEFGFPSVDGATNQPNVFYDPAASASAFPRRSRGQVDFHAQRQGISATLLKWNNSPMIERLFLWTWDARPYPFYPDLTEIWADGGNWRFGHWVQGKLGLSTLAAIVQDLCLRAGLSSSAIDVSALQEVVEGYVIDRRMDAATAIAQPMQGYFFDAVESDGKLTFIPRGGTSVKSITEAELIPDRRGQHYEVVRAEEGIMPRTINVLYMNRHRDYQTGNQQAQRQAGDASQSETIRLPIVFSEAQARRVAEVALYDAWTARNRILFDVPSRYAALEPADVFTLTVGGIIHVLRVVRTETERPGVLRIEAVAEDATLYQVIVADSDENASTQSAQPVSASMLTLLDIPALPADALDAGVLRMAVTPKTDNWRGATVFRSPDGGNSYDRYASVNTQATMGIALGVLADGPTAVFDASNTVTVVLQGEATLTNAPETTVLNGANAAVLGNEIIQFKTATLVEPGQYTLSGLLRGRLGTEWATAGHSAGEPFTLLDGTVVEAQLPVSAIGLSRLYKPVSVGSTLGSTTAQSFTYSGVALRPYAPVHITGERDGSHNLTIRWVRRSRGAAWQDFVDAPLNEASESYDVDILDGNTVVRTLAGLTTPEATYTAAQQTTDFGSPQSAVAVNVYQLSAYVGRGYAGNATL